MKHLIALFLVLGLTACGGGGGAGSPASSATTAKESTFPCATPQTPVPGKYRAVVFDIPRDNVGFTAKGVLATGIETVGPMLDRAKCVGFDTISLQTFIPIDPVTGLIKNFDHNAVALDRDKSIPKDYWKYVDYAKKIGLRVVIKAVPAEYNTDYTLHRGAFPNLPVETMLGTLNTYYKDLATLAQTHQVDAIYAGLFQMGFDTQQYTPQWQTIVNSIRSVYSGKLIYATCRQCDDNVVWGMVDIVSTDFTTDTTPACSAAVLQIKNHYTNTVEDVRTISRRYNKPVWLEQVKFDTIGCNLAPNINTYDLLLAGQLNHNHQPNPDWQMNSIRSVFEVVAEKLSSEVSGLEFGVYIPWTQAEWIQSPNSESDRLWNTFDKLGYSLYNNDQAQFTFEEYLGKPWNYRIYY